MPSDVQLLAKVSLGILRVWPSVARFWPVRASSAKLRCKALEKRFTPALSDSRFDPRDRYARIFADRIASLTFAIAISQNNFSGVPSLRA